MLHRSYSIRGEQAGRRTLRVWRRLIGQFVGGVPFAALPQTAFGKYDLSRQPEAALSFRGAMMVKPIALLNAA